MTGRWFREGARGWLGLNVVVLMQLVAAGTAQAEPARRGPAEPFRLVWSSSAGCSRGARFVRELAERTSLLREAQADEHGITLIVETFPSATGVRGQLTIHKPDGDLTVRDVPGANCQEVESAMALIAALMVDPLAASAEPRRAESQPRPGAPSEAEPEPLRTGSLRLEHHLTARTAVAPGWSWGQSLGVTLSRETGGLFRPSLGLSAQSTSAVVLGAHGSAELDWAAAQLALCPLALGEARSLELSGCATLQLGHLRGTGFSTENPASQDVLWSSAGLEIHGLHQLVGPLLLSWEGSFLFPFSRPRFFLEPEQTLHRVPVWGLSFGVGTGLRFF